jgi:hypothetical protein
MEIYLVADKVNVLTIGRVRKSSIIYKRHVGNYGQLLKWAMDICTSWGVEYFYGHLYGSHEAIDKALVEGYRDIWFLSSEFNLLLGRERASVLKFVQVDAL